VCKRPHTDLCLDLNSLSTHNAYATNSDCTRSATDNNNNNNNNNLSKGGCTQEPALDDSCSTQLYRTIPGHSQQAASGEWNACACLTSRAPQARTSQAAQHSPPPAQQQ
jgi:hypothetical protein